MNDIHLHVETHGDRGAPPLLLIGHSMLTWPDELCERLASERFVIRYDQRDTGASTTHNPEKPAYTLRDLVDDSARVLDGLDLDRAHVAGLGTGGWIAQLMALDHSARVASLTLIAARPTAPGRADRDLPDHDPAIMDAIMSAQAPDWSDRGAAVEFMVENARLFAGSGGFDADDARERYGRIYDRADGSSDAVIRSNLMATVYAHLDCRPRWRNRLGGITAPTLVVHGVDDPFFPYGNGEALAREIPDAKLLPLEGVGQELPRRAWDDVVPALLAQTRPAPVTGT